MVRMPKAPDGWFDADFGIPENSSDIDPGFSPGREAVVPAFGSLWDALPDTNGPSALNWLMEPDDLLETPGLPQHIYEQAAKDDRDGLGRSGPDHATFGCIRTTDDGTAAITDAMRSDDPVTKITIRNNR